jgi:hypothetical protein
MPAPEGPARRVHTAGNGAGDAVKAVSAIVSAVANGELTPGEAGELAKVVDAYSRTLEMVA